MVKEKSSRVQIPAVANYGIRPTVEQQHKAPVLEIHCLEQPDVSIWQEGAQLEMELLNFLRPEMKFCNVEELSVQIRKDCIEARSLFSELL